jgi:hypothetical protein
MPDEPTPDEVDSELVADIKEVTKKVDEQPVVGRPPKTTVDAVTGRKSCNSCGLVKKFRHFSQLEHGIGGVHSTCKRCRRDHMRHKRKGDAEA